MTTHTHPSTRTRIRPTKVEIEFLTELLSFKIDDVFKLSLFFSSTEIESGRECVCVREKERERKDLQPERQILIEVKNEETSILGKKVVSLKPN